MIAACDVHIDMAIDDYVDKQELPPEIQLASESDATEDIPCTYCGHTAKYLVIEAT